MAGAAVGPLDVTFEAELEQSPAEGGWTYLVWPRSAEFFGTRGLVKVAATIDGVPVRTSFMALGDGRHKLPVKAEVRRTHRQAGRRPGDRRADRAPGLRK